MKSVLFILAASIPSAGCLRAYTVTMGDQPSAQAHYVVVKQTAAGQMVVYDCLSRPDGKVWEPTCKRVDLPGAMAR